MKTLANRFLALLLIMVMFVCCTVPVSADQMADESCEAVEKLETPLVDKQDDQTRGSYIEVGVLTIVASQGHAFLVLENTSTMDYDIGPYTVDPGEIITIGTFPALDPLRPRSGIYFNFEAYCVYENPYSYYGRYSLSAGLEYADILAIDSYVSTPSNNTWMEGMECYVFAARVWNLATDYTLPADGTLLIAIKNTTGRDPDCDLPARPKSDAYYMNSYGVLVPIP